MARLSSLSSAIEEPVKELKQLTTVLMQLHSVETYEISGHAVQGAVYKVSNLPLGL